MRERMWSLVPFVRRWRWVCAGVALALVLTGTLVVAAHQGPPSTANKTPVATSGSARASATAKATATVVPTRVASPTVGPDVALGLACTVHSSPGDGDDSVDMALACTVAGMPTTDTGFSLNFGVLDPLGHEHPLTQTCKGTLQGGKGSCQQSYTFIFAFSARPAPVTGLTVPSHHYLGPVTPTAI